VWHATVVIRITSLIKVVAIVCYLSSLSSDAGAGFGRRIVVRRARNRAGSLLKSLAVGLRLTFAIVGLKIRMLSAFPKAPLPND
jgi:hypothetical protein